MREFLRANEIPAYTTTNFVVIPDTAVGVAVINLNFVVPKIIYPL